MQKAYKFDKETLVKIIKGALISATGSMALAILNYLSTAQFDNATIAYIVAWAVPTLTNVVKEFIKGK